MPSRSAFGSKRFINTTSTALKPFTVMNLLGLNTTLPSDVLDVKYSPKLENARVYQRVAEKNQVAISTRKGQSVYTSALGEASDNSYDNSATAGDTNADVTKNKYRAETFTTVSAGRLTRINLSLRESNAAGPLRVDIHTDNAGEPGTKIAQSSILPGDVTASYTDVSVYFVDAPLLTATTDYWIVTYGQINGSGTYEWESHTAGSTGLISQNAGLSWTTSSIKSYYEVFLSTDTKPKGMTRYYKEGSTPETIIAAGQDVYKEVSGAFTSIVGTLNAAATKYRFCEANDLQFFVNGNNNPKKYDGTTVTDIGGTPPVSSICVMHANRLFLVEVGEPNRIVWSNIADYETFESTSFAYVPAPKTGDPITSLTSYQGNLVVGTRSGKYVLYGSDEGDFTLRKASGSRGVVSHEAQCIVGNYMYAMGDDGIYRFNGTNDVSITDAIQPDIDSITDKESVFMINWQQKLRVYYSVGSTENNRMLMFDTITNQWMKDTGVSVSYAHPFLDNPKDADSQVRLMEASGKVVQINYAEESGSDLGRPIEFKFWSKYFHMGSPMLRKRIKRFYPIMRAQDEGFELIIKIDRDEREDPVPLTPIALQSEGPIWGEFVWGEEEWGSITRVDPRIPVPGTATSFQFRFEQTGVNTSVEVIGFVLYYKTKKPR